MADFRLNGTTAAGQLVPVRATDAGRLNFAPPAGAKGPPGAPGATGASAYQVAQANGFVGTVDDWLASLVGPAGTPAIPVGAHAYELALANGFIGTRTAWLTSLRGTNGTDGTDGASAYDLALSRGFVGTPTAWINSLKGNTGAAGAEQIKCFRARATVGRNMTSLNQMEKVIHSSVDFNWGNEYDLVTSTHVVATPGFWMHGATVFSAAANNTGPLGIYSYITVNSVSVPNWTVGPTQQPVASRDVWLNPILVGEYAAGDLINCYVQNRAAGATNNVGTGAFWGFHITPR